MRRSGALRAGLLALAIALGTPGPFASARGGGSPSRTAWSISLAIADELGRPLDAAVEFVHRDGSTVAARADATGRLARAGTSNPPISARVTAPAHVTAALDTSALTFEATWSARVVLPRCRAYVLRVVDEDGVGVGGAAAHVKIEPGETVGPWRDYGVPVRPEASSSPDGTLEIEGVPASVRSHLVVRACPYATARLPLLETAPGRVARLPDVVLRATAGLTGRVVTAKGRPVPGVRVGVGATRQDASRSGSGLDGEFVEKAFASDSPPPATDADGRFRVGDLGEGKAEYLLDGDAYFAVRGVAVGLARRRVVDLGEIVVQAAVGEIAGRIVADDGTPLAAYVEVGEFPDVAGYANSWRDGNFRLAGLRTTAPSVELHAFARGHWSLRKTIAVGRHDVRLVLRRAAIASVRVETPGEPGPVRVGV